VAVRGTIGVATPPAVRVAVRAAAVGPVTRGIVARAVVPSATEAGPAGTEVARPTTGDAMTGPVVTVRGTTGPVVTVRGTTGPVAIVRGTTGLAVTVPGTIARVTIAPEATGRSPAMTIEVGRRAPIAVAPGTIDAPDRATTEDRGTVGRRAATTAGALVVRTTPVARPDAGTTVAGPRRVPAPTAPAAGATTAPAVRIAVVPGAPTTVGTVGSRAPSPPTVVPGPRTARSVGTRTRHRVRSSPPCPRT
jgi:hypothetical protein